jgi:hypothetical protein
MEGWRCPGCGHCFAPFMTECPHCVTPSFTTSGSVVCEHEYGAETSGGRVCRKCGQLWLDLTGASTVA